MDLQFFRGDEPYSQSAENVETHPDRFLTLVRSGANAGEQLPVVMKSDTLMTMNTQPPSDDELFRDWNETHSMEAFERLYRREHPRLVRCLRARGWSVPDAEEGAQQAWLQAWPRWEPINFAWLVTVAHQYLISQNRKTTKAVLHGDGFDPMAREDSRPEKGLLQRERDGEVSDCISEHSADRDVMACVVRHKQGFSISEIAQKNGCTTNAASCMVLRGMKKLRTCLEGKGNHAAKH